MKWLGLLTLSLVLSGAVHAVAPVEAVALFKNRAMVRTLSGEEMIKVGETSEQGVTLLSADPRGAKVRYRGQIYNLQLSNRVGARFTAPTKEQVRINRDQLGQYRVGGTVNGAFVNFLVDTGASVIAMSERHAREIGLPYQQSGRQGSVVTAQGNAPAYFLDLDNVRVGGIQLSGVEATVIEGNFPVEVLLGMSFLGQLSMQDQAGVLTLTAEY